MKNMTIVTNDLDSDALINFSDLDQILYIDLDKNSTDIGDYCEVEPLIESGKALRFPCYDELMPYENVLSDFITEYEIDVPKKNVSRYVNWKYPIDFWEYQEKRYKELFDSWCKVHNIQIVSVS